MFGSTMKSHATIKSTPHNLSFIMAALKWLYLCARVQSERRYLLKLDEHELRDAGISREEAIREGHRSFGDLPDVVGQLPGLILSV